MRAPDEAAGLRGVGDAARLARLRGWIAPWMRWVPACVWVLWILQTALEIRLLGDPRTWVDSLPLFLAGLAATYAAIWIYGWFVVLLLPRNRFVAIAVTMLLILIYVQMLIFRWHSGGHFEWAVLWRFRLELFDPEVRGMVGSMLGWRTYLFAGLGLGLAAAAELVGAFLSRPHRPARRLLAFALASAAVAMLAWDRGLAGDEISASLRSIRASYEVSRLIPSASDVARYPFVRASLAAGVGPAPSEPPNIFFVVVESFNANFVEARTGDGREYTPFFNSLIPKGVYVENFHGNSMESPRGQLSLLFSIWPSIRGRVFQVYRHTQLHGLAEILHEHGYFTIFDEAARLLRFEDTGHFMAANGFDVRRASLERDPPDRPAGSVWGWGLQDDVFFKEFFAFLDAQEAGDAGAGRRPVFAFLPTISSHFPDNSIPADQRHLFASGVDGKSGYGNSIYLADTYLRTFFQQLAARPYLKNSIVVVTGDHSYPAGEHGNTDSQLGAYEEVFRTPLLILWDGHLAPRRIRGELWSQVDVAPTVLDLVGIDAPNHFLGRSILRGFDPNRDFVHLVQPFDGIYLGAMTGHLKYLHNVASGRESLYDLAKDPREERDVFAQYRNSPQVAALRREVGRVLLNQRLTEQDRIWPRQAGTKKSAGVRTPTPPG